jgi:hypothetical protein
MSKKSKIVKKRRTHNIVPTEREERILAARDRQMAAFDADAAASGMFPAHFDEMAEGDSLHIYRKNDRWVIVSHDGDQVNVGEGETPYEALMLEIER